MQCNGVNVGVLLVSWLEFCRGSKFGKRLIRSIESGQCKSECMSHASVVRGGHECRAQHGFAIAVAAQSPIEVGKIDGRYRVLRA